MKKQIVSLTALAKEVIDQPPETIARMKKLLSY